MGGSVQLPRFCVIQVFEGGGGSCLPRLKDRNLHDGMCFLSKKLKNIQQRNMKSIPVIPKITIWNMFLGVGFVLHLL